MLPIPGLAEHAITFKSLADAIHLRNHVIRRLDLAEADPAGAARHLCFVFVGAGYAGVEALAEMKQLVQDALRHYPRLRDVPQRWVLIDAGADDPGRGARAGSRTTPPDQLRRGGVEILSSIHAGIGRTACDHPLRRHRIETETVVWTAGVTANPLVADLGLPLDERGRIRVDSQLRVEGRTDIWALGDSARVPNAATPGQFDPPTCQHALRQARTLADGFRGDPTAYGYRSIGEGATLGRDVGIARVLGLHVRGRLGAFITRVYHVQAVPLGSRRLRILTDGLLSMMFRRDITELGSLEVRRSEQLTVPLSRSR